MKKKDEYGGIPSLLAVELSRGTAWDEYTDSIHVTQRPLMSRATKCGVHWQSDIIQLS